MPEQLYTSADVAKVFGVTITTVCNWQSRGVMEKHGLPEAAFVYGAKVSPLWTQDQFDEIVANEVARLQERVSNVRRA